MGDWDIPGNRRALVLSMKEQHFSKRARRGVFIGFLLTVLTAVILLLTEFGFLLIPKDSCRLQSCTLVSMEYVRGKTGDWVSFFQDAAGSQYRITASRQDYIGREISPYTKGTFAYRTQYEFPRAFLPLTAGFAAVLIFGGLELWYLVKYLGNH